MLAISLIKRFRQSHLGISEYEGLAVGLPYVHNRCNNIPYWQGLFYMNVFKTSVTLRQKELEESYSEAKVRWLSQARPDSFITVVITGMLPWRCVLH